MFTVLSLSFQSALTLFSRLVWSASRFLFPLFSYLVSNGHTRTHISNKKRGNNPSGSLRKHGHYGAKKMVHNARTDATFAQAKARIQSTQVVRRTSTKQTKENAEEALPHTVSDYLIYNNPKIPSGWWIQTPPFNLFYSRQDRREAVLWTRRKLPNR